MSTTQNKRDVANVEHYSVRRTIRGGRVIGFKCPACAMALKCDLQDAGNVEHCPRCSTSFLVPGGKEYVSWMNEQKEKAAKASANISASSKPPKQAPVARPTQHRTLVPDYPVTRLFILAFVVVGILEIVAAAIVFAAMIHVENSGSSPVLAMPLVIVLLVHALLNFFFAEILRIARDVGRNSWHMRRSLERLAQGGTRADLSQ